MEELNVKNATTKKTGTLTTKKINLRNITPINMEKHYWKGLEELEQSPAFTAQAEKEFANDLPVLSAVAEPITTEGKTSRRDFLKMLGFSVTAATIASACEMPVRKAVPYALKPEEITPGVANYYASAFVQGGEFASVVVKTREGRPIKIDGNKLSGLNKGGSSARAQASILSLYDGARYRAPQRGNETTTWAKADSEVLAKLQEIKAKGGKIVLFTSTIASPSTQAAINEFKAAFGAEHLVNDAISYNGILDANEKTFGKRVIPAYSFEKANVIVSLGADFLGTWVSPEEFSAAWAVNRSLSKDKKTMSRHIQIESVLSMTGANADKRVTVTPNEEETAAVDLLTALKGGTPKNAKLAKVAEELFAAKGASIVVSGSNDVNTQIVVNAINDLLGNYGKTISFASAYNTRQGSDKAALDLLAGLESGATKAVIFYNSNPLHTHPKADKLAEALKKAELTVSLSERRDETSVASQYVLPDNNWLESWNDLSPKVGVYNVGQPTITKLFDTRQAQETLLKLAGNEKPDFYEYIRKYWNANVYPKQSKTVGFEGFWDIAVHDGEITTGAGSEVSFNGLALADAVNAVSSTYAGADAVQVKFYENVNIGNGFWADNPYLQENPDPITKVTWDNYVSVPVKWAKENKIKNDLEAKEYTLVEVTANGKTIKLPAIAVPGQANGSFGIALGYGRTVVTHDELKVGQNAYPLLGDKFTYSTSATIKVTSETQKVAITQTHHNIVLKGLSGVKKRGVVKETTLPEWTGNPKAGNTDRDHIQELLVTLYDEHTKPGHHWTLTVDLNTCVGCGACVTACNIENNVPVVGKAQVIRSREMHWLRIDRYFTYTDMIEGGAETLDPDKLDVVFQPMMCQHCDNAPCENVCPVSATNHSSEGLNQMAYNRCIGTRYCANNCPYKVRRFNWYDFQGADSFVDNKVAKSWVGDDIMTQTTLELQSPLTRMVLNPDVTVRSRGVIEKCSFCVQLIQDGKLSAKRQNRPLKDGDIATACETACATGAIKFGDRNNKESRVYAEMNDERAFGVVEELHTLPNVLYLTKVRNREAVKA